jgi:hypothetical protein
MGIIDAIGMPLLIYVHGESVGPWMQAMHFCFSVGALMAPLCVRLAMAYSESGRDYSMAFWFVGSSLIIPVLLLCNV